MGLSFERDAAIEYRPPDEADAHMGPWLAQAATIFAALVAAFGLLAWWLAMIAAQAMGGSAL